MRISTANASKLDAAENSFTDVSAAYESFAFTRRRDIIRRHLYHERLAEAKIACVLHGRRADEPPISIDFRLHLSSLPATRHVTASLSPLYAAHRAHEPRNSLWENGED